MASDRETTTGFYPKTSDDGSYVKEKAGAGWILVHPDGHTITNLTNGNTYDLASIGITLEDDGSTVIDSPTAIDFGNRLTAANDGDGTATVGVADEAIEDLVAALLASDPTSSISYDDTNNTLTIGVADGGIGTTQLGSGAVTTAKIDTDAVTGSEIAAGAVGSTQLDSEGVEDEVAAILTGAGNISVTQDDANNQINVDTAALNEEQVEDVVNGLLSSSGNLAWNYDDANNNLTISLSGPLTDVQIGTSSNPAPGSHFNSVNTGELLLGGGTWTEDDNSPLTVSGSTGNSISLAGQYDMIKILPVDGSEAVDVDMQVNGDTGSNYDYILEDGTQPSTKTHWPSVLKSDLVTGSVITVTGDNAGAGIGFQSESANMFRSEETSHGTNLNVSTPLNSIRLFSDAGNSFSLTALIYGFDG